MHTCLKFASEQASRELAPPRRLIINVRVYNTVINLQRSNHPLPRMLTYYIISANCLIPAVLRMRFILQYLHANPCYYTSRADLHWSFIGNGKAQLIQRRGIEYKRGEG
jgi:hypothetical protein